MAAGQIPNWFVVIMGLGTVFVGLISIIIIILVMGKVIGSTVKNESASVAVPAQSPAVTANEMSPEEHGRVVAAAAAAIAEELGTDISAIRICSMKRVS